MTYPFEVLSDGASTLGSLLCQRRTSVVDPIRIVHSFEPGFVNNSSSSRLVSRAQLFAHATRCAQQLAERGVKQGDFVLLIVEKIDDFLANFFAIQLLGAIAVPLVPPWSLQRMDSHVERIRSCAQRCRPRATVISENAKVAIVAFMGATSARSILGEVLTPLAEATDTVSPSDDGARLWTEAALDSERPAMVQFTSGSTSAPRGVILSHRALLTNCWAIGRALAFDEPSHLGCSWLPLYHDMGLIGHVLVPLLWGIPTVLLPPASFALRPASWLEAVAGYGATISTAPNFAYQLCATRLPEEKTAHLDLSRWRVALCGGEPILARSIEQFSSRFETNGFRRSALCPVYGLAEASLAVTLSAVKIPPAVERVHRDEFAESGVARLANAAEVVEDDFLNMVSSGQVAEGHEVRIMGEDGEPLEDGVEGAIVVKGPSLMSGYLEAPEATDAVLKDGWLMTGDRGYRRAGELYVSGREKEAIIKAGRNLYPQELEDRVGQVEGVRAGRIAAFAVFNEDLGTDQLIIVAETTKTKSSERAEMERHILAGVFALVGVRPDIIKLVEPGTLSKTSSGKMQRLEAQRRFLSDSLVPGRAGLWSHARLIAARARARLGL